MAGGVTPGFTHIQLAIGRSDIGHQGQVADERVGDSDAGERLVAGVLHGDVVVDDFACGVGGATSDRGVFDDVQAGRLLHGDGGVVGVRAGLVRVGGRHVDDVVTGIDLGLGHHMGACPGPGFAHVEFTVGCSGIGHQHQVTDHRVAHGDARQSLVAGVLHGDGVADDFTGHIGGATGHRGFLDDVERGHQLLVTKIHIHGFGVHGRDDNALGVGGGLYPACLLDFAHQIGVVVRVHGIGIGCDGEAVAAIGIGEG